VLSALDSAFPKQRHTRNLKSLLLIEIRYIVCAANGGTLCL